MIVLFTFSEVRTWIRKYLKDTFFRRHSTLATLTDRNSSTMSPIRQNIWAVYRLSADTSTLSMFKNSARLAWYTVRRSKWFLQLVTSRWGVDRRRILPVCLAAGCRPLLIYRGHPPEMRTGAVIWLLFFRRFLEHSRWHLLCSSWGSRKPDRVYCLTVLQHDIWGSWCRQISAEPPESQFGCSHSCWLL
jgi:hypothetical protein